MKSLKTRLFGSWKTLENRLLLSISFVFSAISVLFFMKGMKVGLVSTLSFEKIYVSYAVAAMLLLAVLPYIFRRPVSFLPFAKMILLVFLPSAAILFYAFSYSGRFTTIPSAHSIIMIVHAYLIAACLYFLFRYKNYERPADFFRDLREKDRDGKEIVSKPSLSILGRYLGWLKKEGVVTILMVLAIVLLNIGFGSYHLSEFAAVDEPLWTFGRITKFWSNVNDGEFQKTMISDKPGITVAILSGIGLNFESPSNYKQSSWGGEVAYNYPDIRNLNFALRFPIALFCSLMLFAFYFLIKKLLGKTVALLSLIFIGLSPLLIGISTIINPDGLLWVFLPLSMISYFIYLKDKGNRFLYLAGIFLGLAILTKYVANILYVFFFGLIFLEYILNSEKYKEEGASEYFRKAFVDYLILLFFSLLTYLLLLPAAWINLSRVFEGTIYSKAFIKVWPIFLAVIAIIIIDMLLWKNKATEKVLGFLSRFKAPILIISNAVFLFFVALTMLDTYLGMKIFDLEAILASPKSAFETNGFMGLMSANFYSLVFGIIPIAFLGLIIGVIYSIKNARKNKETVIWSTYLIIFILLYYIASTASQVSATVRYQIVIYPVALIISALGINYLIESPRIKKYIFPNALMAAIILISLYSLNSIRPFYFSYASDLLPKQYVLNIKDMGDGSYEAAQYLNSLPGAKDMIVWTDKRGVCSFFMGKCHSGFNFDKQKISFDYFVVSSGRENRTTKMTLSRINGGNTTLFRLDKLYDIADPEYKVEIGNRPNNFVKVINSKNIQ